MSSRELGPERVTLSAAERLLVSTVGSLRQAISAERTPHFRTDDPLTANVVGAAGEYAASLALDTAWRALLDAPTTTTDVGVLADGLAIQVRATTRPSGRLVVAEHDDPGAAFVLARVDAGVRFVDLVGWAWGRACLRTEYVEQHGDRPAAFFVPTSALRPLGELREGRRRLASPRGILAAELLGVSA
jgi:hypothetical protein